MAFKEKILEIIDRAKIFLKDKSLNTLSEIVNGYAKIEYHTRPGKASLENIKSIGETAYQRAIFLSENTALNPLNDVVTWNDLELPIVFSKSSRRRCIDLIGSLKDKTPVLCELKYASQKSNSNSPIYAVIELLIYYYLTKNNSKELDEKKVFHTNSRGSFKWSDFNSNSIFIVGANEKYWNYWKKRYEKQTDKIDKWLTDLPIKVCFFSSEDFDFKEQKENKEKYTPSVLGKTEWTEVFL